MNTLANLDTDIAAQMLSALVLDQEPTEQICDSISLEERKRYLKKYADAMTIGDKKELGNILIMNNKRAALVSVAGGIAINLDTLPDNIIQQMYSLVLYKKEKKI